jgi:predicted transcriptional regulator
MRLTAMPIRFDRKRTDAESQIFKAKIVSLRREGKSMTKIAEELGITKQYVSLVLNEVGLGGKLETGVSFVKVPAKSKDEVQEAIAELQTQGNYALAEGLRNMLYRRAKTNEMQMAKRRANRKKSENISR